MIGQQTPGETGRRIREQSEEGLQNWPGMEKAGQLHPPQQLLVIIIYCKSITNTGSHTVQYS